MLKNVLCGLLSLSTLLGAALTSKANDGDLPKIPREFRSAWIATVANIDWPSKRTLTTEQQKAELINILDTSVQMNLNSLVFQIRPMCDALYQSDLEPWSEFLTGAMGKAPDPYYDPLEFIIEESHKRGIELHVWFNPYRARHTSSRGEVASNHVSKTKPGIVREYGKYLWLDPAEEETKRHSLDVILDVVRRYKVDGVHLDDYFYPYKSYANGADFPDEAPWQRYLAGGGTMKRADWRRDHVNDFVERFYRDVKKENPLVKVGISPFGIWRPGVPEGTHTGFDQYSELYADAKLWLNKGWVDYWTPQLYWPIAAEKQSYPILLKWWVEENHEKRHIWPGNYTSQVGGAGKWKPEEIINQVKATRDIEGASGNVHFSMVAFTQNRQGLTDMLREGVYAKPALVPASPWLSDRTPAQPQLKSHRPYFGRETTVSWESSGSDQVRLWVLYRKQRNGPWDYQLIPAAGETKGSLRLPRDTDVAEIAVSAVDFNGTEGPVARRRF
ncbi:MAG: family 10 glycosylhydrolase [Verrucomicrobia bacterium]|nr:family 10 glycosylhydrolase [Verrucomicrobiota bacterium]